MRFISLTTLILALSLHIKLSAQQDNFSQCQVSGSITIYDQQQNTWFYSDSIDAVRTTQPASTFKIINLLIALETGSIKSPADTIYWPGSTDTTLYGYRPEIYRDMTVSEAFEESAGWAFMEIAKRIGKERYREYLKRAEYGNHDLSEKGVDFWNFGAFGVSPQNQVQFLMKLYNNQLPFKKRNMELVKSVMVTESFDGGTIFAKTGWTRVEGKDIGWWSGYFKRGDNVYFFSTRISKSRLTRTTDFGACRKIITRAFLKQFTHD